MQKLKDSLINLCAAIVALTLGYIILAGLFYIVWRF